MPIGVPRIIYCWGEELPAQWTDIYNFIFRRRMVFLMQYLDDELCNQICGLLINIHMEDRSKELEKKETERSGMFSKGTKSTSASQSRLQQGNDDNKGMGAGGPSSYSNKSRSMEDLLNADEDLGISDINTLEQSTLQKITTEWLNWNAQFFDYSDEPYLFYLAELLSKDFNKSQNNYSTHSHLIGSEVSQLLNMLKNSVTQTEQNRKSEKRPFKNQASMQMGEVYSPFRTNTKKFLKTGSKFINLQRKPKGQQGVDQGFATQASSVDNAFENFLGTSSVKKKQKLLQMLQNYQNSFKNNITTSSSGSSYSTQATYNGKEKTISNLLQKLSHKDFSSKLEEPGWLNSDSFGEHQRQKNLRSSFSLENNFGVNGTARTHGGNSAPWVPTRPQRGGCQPKSFNYLNSGLAAGNSQNEFRDYYRKQTERTLIDEESKKVFVIINSFGGSVGNGITVHDALQFIKAGSLTLALGVAASAASLALAGGTIGERYVTEGCHVMIHQPESSLRGQASDIWIDSQEIMKIRLDVAEIYSLSTYRPRHKILRDLDRDFYLTATETIQYGLADEIATNEVMHVILEETNRAWDYHDSKQQRLLESRESASSGLDTQTQN